MGSSLKEVILVGEVTYLRGRFINANLPARSERRAAFVFMSRHTDGVVECLMRYVEGIIKDLTWGDAKETVSIIPPKS